MPTVCPGLTVKETSTRAGRTLAGREIAADGDYRLADRQAVGPQTAAQSATGVEDGRAAAAMDGAIDPAAVKAAVGGIDDGVDGVIGEIADIKADAGIEIAVQGSVHGGRLNVFTMLRSAAKKAKKRKPAHVSQGARANEICQNQYHQFNI